MRRLIVDLDGTLTIHDPSVSYADRAPNRQVIEQLLAYKERGFTITVMTARSMRTYAGDIGKINVQTLPAVLNWLENNSVPFDDVIVGKPWCGTEGFYIDDKSIRPDEFVNMTYEEVAKLLNLGEADGQ